MASSISCGTRFCLVLTEAQVVALDLEGPSAVGSSADSKKENKKGVGERCAEGAKSEPFPWIDIAFGSATHIFSDSPVCSARKFDMAAFRAEMAARFLALNGT